MDKKVPPFAYGSKDNFLINDPEKRWTYMVDWAAQNKSAINTSRVQALKTLPDPATGKPYNMFNPTGTKAGYYDSSIDTQLGEYVREKLKNVGQIHFDHNKLGGSIKHSDLEFYGFIKRCSSTCHLYEGVNCF